MSIEDCYMASSDLVLEITVIRWLAGCCALPCWVRSGSLAYIARVRLRDNPQRGLPPDALKRTVAFSGDSSAVAAWPASRDTRMARCDGSIAKNSR